MANRYLPQTMSVEELRRSLAQLDSDWAKGAVSDEDYYQIRMDLETMLAVLEGQKAPEDAEELSTTARPGRQPVER